MMAYKIIRLQDIDDIMSIDRESIEKDLTFLGLCSFE